MYCIKWRVFAGDKWDPLNLNVVQSELLGIWLLWTGIEPWPTLGSAHQGIMMLRWFCHDIAFWGTWFCLVYEGEPHPLYLPDLTQSDIFLFPQMKKVLKGKHFANVEEVKQKMTEALKGIKIDKFKNCFEQWKKRLNRCIASNGEYFESDWSLNM